MKRYPKYKPTNIPWIGEIPEHWDEMKLKYYAMINPSNVDKNSSEDEEEILLCNYIDVYKNEFISSSLEFMRATATKSEINKFTVEKGDVIATKDSETPTDIANPALVREEIENLVCGYHLTHIRTERSRLLGEYLFRLLQSKNINAFFEISANGITRYGLGVDAFKNVLILLPSIQEQIQISAYLDSKTQKIDKLISNKQKQIELFKEERQAIINNVVTGKFLPITKEETQKRFKPSGIPWLGDIPEHWEVKKLKYVAYLKSGEFINAENISPVGDFPVLGGNGLRGYTNTYTHKGNFILIGRQGALCGNINLADEKFYATEHAVVVTILDASDTIWLAELLRTMNLNQHSQASAQPGLAVETIKNLPIPFPPYAEQKTISSFLIQETKKINFTISKIEKEISLLQEFRTALISEVVTGKIDVRN